MFVVSPCRAPSAYIRCPAIFLHIINLASCAGLFHRNILGGNTDLPPTFSAPSRDCISMGRCPFREAPRFIIKELSGLNAIQSKLTCQSLNPRLQPVPNIGVPWWKLAHRGRRRTSSARSGGAFHSTTCWLFYSFLISS